jgi:V8-like Glu-specific endopeptidase
MNDVTRSPAGGKSEETVVPPGTGTGPGDSPRVGVVLPGDNRQRVAVSTNAPSKWVGQIESTWPDKSVTTGTGTLLGDRHILTCAHNFYDTETQKSCTRARFRPGLNRSGGGALQTPYGHYDLETMIIPEAYLKHGAPAPPVNGIKPAEITGYLHDYSVGRLNKHVDDGLGESMLQADWPGENVVSGLACMINGYSSDLDPTGCTQYTRNGNVGLDDNGDFLTYRMSTYYGDSGAPVYYQPPGKPYWYIIGVHVTGYPDSPPGASNGRNFAPALSGETLNWINKALAGELH